MNNGKAFDEFINGFIDNPKIVPDIALLARRIRDDEEFMLSYLQFTGIMMIRFPNLFRKVVSNLINELMNEKEK